MKTVSIIIPAKDEEESLPYVLAELLSLKRMLAKQYTVEIIVVDDHSTDTTAQISRQKGISVIPNSSPSGKGHALRTGFSHSRGDLIVMLDADHSHEVNDIPLFLQKLENGAGLVIGSRIMGGTDEHTRLRAFGNEILTYCVNAFLGANLTDALNGYKAFRKDIINDFTYTSTDFEIEIELIANTMRKHFPIVEVASHERARMGGLSKSLILTHGRKFFLRIIREYIANIYASYR